MATVAKKDAGAAVQAYLDLQGATYVEVIDNRDGTCDVNASNPQSRVVRNLGLSGGGGARGIGGRGAATVNVSKAGKSKGKPKSKSKAGSKSKPRGRGKSN
ncbi:MAG: hypothetical protein QOF78_3979 [Phycisphaerales bacterium]|jgi:hypothetical protein|nr:hypothetical protein [Phycisphaerales bacterium]